MDVLVIVIEVFIGGGLFVIFLAPALKLFKKAGRSQWLALVPVANVLTFMKITDRPITRAGIASLIAFPAFIVIYDLLMFQGGTIEWSTLVLNAVAVLLVAVFVYPFPLLSVTMLASVVMLLALSSPAPQGPALMAVIVTVGLAAFQSVLDFVGWKSLLAKLGRPAWQILFLVLPAAAILVLAVVSIIGAPIGLPVILGLAVPALFIGFVYYFYIGYSAKVRYRIE